MAKESSKESTPTNVIDLKSLIPSSEQLALKLAWVTFRGMKFQIRYISKAILSQLGEQCVVTAYDATSRGRTRQLDPKKFTRALAKALVEDWEPPTVKQLSNLMPITTDGMSAEQLASEMPFTFENLILVMENTHELDQFLQDCAIDASIFRSPESENIRKN